jgi:hypothetical protein
MSDNIFINRFDLPYKNINKKEIEYIEKNLCNYLYIYNEDFNDDLNNIPKNIKICGLYSKKFNLQYIPQYIKWLNLFDLDNHCIIPNTIDILYIGHRYLTKFPNILLTISYGLKVLILEVMQNDVKEIDLNYLPESIEKILLTFDYCNITVNLNKVFSKLKCIYISDINSITNIDDVTEYCKKNNVEILENYLSDDMLFQEYILN